MNTMPPCPECGRMLNIERHCRVEYPMMVPFSQKRDEPAPRKTFIYNAALCTACDFAIEIR